MGLNYFFRKGFTLNGKPVLKTFLKVTGRFETSTKATVISPPTVLLHFHLESQRHVAHFTIVEQLMQEYYYEEESQLQVLDLPFDVGKFESASEWNRNAGNILNSLTPHTHVIVFITTHSDPDSGDLWLGKDEEGKPCAAAADDVSADLFINFILIITMDSTVAGHRCRSVRAHYEGLHHVPIGMWIGCEQPIVFRGAEERADEVSSHIFFKYITDKFSNSLGIGNALAFTAERLSTVNTADLLTKVTKSVVINGFDFSESLKFGLENSGILGRHTNVVHFTPQEVTRYIWAHKKYQPWGKPAPVQCPQCGILQAWNSVYMSSPKGYRLECRNPKCGRAAGRERMAFQVLFPNGAEFFKTGLESGGGISGWLKLIDTQL